MSGGAVEGVGTGAHLKTPMVDPMKAATHPLKADNDGDAEDRAKLAAAQKAKTPSPSAAPGTLNVKA